MSIAPLAMAPSRTLDLPPLVLVVDDDRTIRFLLTTVLEKDGYRVAQATNGEEGVCLAREQKPELILMDYMMPVMDGVEACARIRRMETGDGTDMETATRPVPIVMVTAAHDDASVKKAIEAGATDYLLKPIILPVLRQRVRTLIDGQRSEAVIHHMAWHDALTGLPNRSAFNQVMAELLHRAAENGEEHVLCFLDLDQFKVVNDTCGHAAGDRLLSDLTAVLKPMLRRDDLLARLGGDEFGILLRNCSIETGQEVADKLRHAVDHFRFIENGQAFRVGASIGVIPLGDGWADASMALAAADSACYGAKERGRNCVYVYASGKEEMRARRTEMSWVARINTAMETGRLRLRRQAIVPCGAGVDEGRMYEVLLYMIDEEGNSVPPGAFLPAAERYNLMQAVDRHVVDSALCRIGTMARDSVGRKDIHSINLSGASLGDGDLLGFIRARMGEHGVEPTTVCFEITETAAVTHLANARRLIDALRGDGCRFFLDDFGSGLSSFAYLKDLPVDVIKLYGGLVVGMDEDPRDRAIVKAMNEVGHALQLKTIAEYVESTAILGRLRELGVDYAQGYAVGHPEAWT